MDIQKKRNKDVDFETDKEYQRIGKELAIDTKKYLNDRRGLK